MRVKGLPALPVRMGRMDARWARGELERFGPRISLTGAAPLRREQIPPRPSMGMVALGASVGVRTFQRLSLLTAMPGERVGDTLSNRSVLGLEYPGEALPRRRWHGIAPVMAVVLWTSAVVLLLLRVTLEQPVVTVPLPLASAVVLAGTVAADASDRLGVAEASLRRAMRVAPHAGHVVLARLRSGINGGGDWWTLVEVDGQTVRASSSNGTIAEALADAGFTLEPDDRILVIPHGGPALTEVVAGGIRRSVTGPAMLTDTGDQIGAGQVVVPPRAVVPGSAPMRAAPLVLARLSQIYGDVVKHGSPDGNAGRIVVQRATPFRLSEDGITEQVRAAASTVGEALRSVGIDVDAADVVVPTLEAPLMPGLRVSVMRAPAVTVAEGDSVVTMRTRVSTVAELLAEQSIDLGALDRVEPGLDAPVPVFGTVRVVRVREEERIEFETLPFQTQVVKLPGLTPGARITLRSGLDGLRQRTILTTIENGEESGQQVRQDTLVRTPLTEIVAEPALSVSSIGVPGAGLLGLDTHGPPPGLNARRVVKMVSTAYDPGPESTGKRPGDPGYGITATGVRFAPGIVAIDPRVIPFFTRVWVPGYGFGVAADTGSDIQGYRVDLGFSTYWEAIQWGRRAVNVYVLD